jgi:hypothetical protein
VTHISVHYSVITLPLDVIHVYSELLTVSVYASRINKINILVHVHTPTIISIDRVLETN